MSAGSRFCALARPNALSLSLCTRRHRSQWQPLFHPALVPCAVSPTRVRVAKSPLPAAWPFRGRIPPASNALAPHSPSADRGRHQQGSASQRRSALTLFHQGIDGFTRAPAPELDDLLNSRHPRQSRRSHRDSQASRSWAHQRACHIVCIPGRDPPSRAGAYLVCGAPHSGVDRRSNVGPSRADAPSLRRRLYARINARRELMVRRLKFHSARGSWFSRTSQSCKRRRHFQGLATCKFCSGTRSIGHCQIEN